MLLTPHIYDYIRNTNNKHKQNYFINKNIKEKIWENLEKKRNLRKNIFFSYCLV